MSYNRRKDPSGSQLKDRNEEYNSSGKAQKAKSNPTIPESTAKRRPKVSFEGNVGCYLPVVLITILVIVGFILLMH